MNATRFVTEVTSPNAVGPLEARSLYQVLQEVTDHRGKQGRRYQAAPISRRSPLTWRLSPVSRPFWHG
jgi:hypothetical protein